MANNNTIKEERFRRIAEKRVNRLLEQMRLLGKCSMTTVYSYTKEQVEQIFSCLQSELNKTRRRFHQASNGKPERFSLRAEAKPFLSEEHYPCVALNLPDGSRLIAAAIDDENYPAINIYLQKSGSHDEEEICFAEYNPERNSRPQVCIGVYHSDSDEPQYYESYEKAEQTENQ